MASLTMMALGWLKFGETQQTNERAGDRVKVGPKKATEWEEMQREKKVRLVQKLGNNTTA